jgi:hypothetical protein
MSYIRDRITARHYATPHPYDVLVYQENGHYYAKDQRGNLICKDSNTACIQEAIDYTSDKGGGIVFLKSGTYELSRNIILRSKVSLIGSGIHSTKLVPLSNFSSDYMIYLEGNKEYLAAWRRISDIYLRNNLMVNYGIYATDKIGAVEMIIERVLIRDPVVAGIYQGQDNGVWTIRDCGIFGGNNKGYGIYMYYTGDSHYENNEIFGFAKGVYAIALGNSVFVDNRIYMARYNSDVDNSGVGMHLHISSGIRILGDRYDNNDMKGLYIRDSRDISVIGTLTWRNGVRCEQESCYGIGIQVYGSSGVVVKDCISIEDYGLGIETIGGQEITIEGCIVRNPCYSVDLQPYCRAFDFYQSSKIIVRNSHAIDGRSTPVMKWGFNFEGNIDLLFDNITARGYTSSEIHLSDNNKLRKNGGTTVINAGTTTATVNHNLICEPSKVYITPLAQPPGPVWVGNITDTSFTVYTSTAPTSALPIAWYAEC